MTKTILLTREGFSMSSVWDEHLCVEDLPEGMFQLSICQYETIGSIYDFVAVEKLYDKDGELKVPKSVGGKAIVGLSDGEYLQTDELYESDTSECFDSASIEVARDFCEKQAWTELRGFDEAWSLLNETIDAEID